MDTLISRYSTRRVFYAVTLAIVILLLLVRYFVIPYLLIDNGNIKRTTAIEISDSILDNLIASFIATAVVGTFYFWLSSRTGDSKLELIPSTSIEDELNNARINTDYWYYSGATGRYTRSMTIPLLAKRAREYNEHKFFQLILLDPSDQDICEIYSNHRSGLKSAKKNNVWTQKNVAIQVLSTIVACAVWKTIEPLIEINIGLKKNYSLFRIDQGQDRAVITREDPREPAILAHKGTLIYKFYKDDFHQSFRQSKKIQLPLKFCNFDDLTPALVRNLFQGLNLNVDCDDSDIEKIIQIVKKAENPYGHV